MDDQLQKVQRILTEWNPLGESAQSVADLNNYRTEAMDILNHIRAPIGSSKRLTAAGVVQTVLNQAFDLELQESDCEDAAMKICEGIRK